MTGGPYDVTIADNEISYNDTCDFEGLLSNSAIGWSNHNPVPPNTVTRIAARSRETATRVASSSGRRTA